MQPPETAFRIPDHATVRRPGRRLNEFGCTDAPMVAPIGRDRPDNDMKIPGVAFLFLFLVFAATAQSPGKYFELKAERYAEDETEYVGVSPAIRESVDDVYGRFIAANPRRFRYLLANNNQHFKALEYYYPNTKKINRLYAARMNADKKFVATFRKMVAPANSKSFRREKYTTAELMKVASRFFFCDTVRPDKSIGSHICIALNGLTEAKFDRDYTLLESFCFEAIFAEIDAARPSRAKVVENFVGYIEENSKKARRDSDAVYLKSVRGEVFLAMQNDAELKRLLDDYFKKNRDNLAFEVSN